MELSHCHREIRGDKCGYLTAKRLQRLGKGHSGGGGEDKVELGAVRVGPSQKSIT